MKKKLLFGIIVFCCGVWASPVLADSLDNDIQDEPGMILTPVRPNIFGGCVIRLPDGTAAIIRPDFYGEYIISPSDKTATVSPDVSGDCIIRLPEGTAVVSPDGSGGYTVRSSELKVVNCDVSGEYNIGE